MELATHFRASSADDHGTLNYLNLTLDGPDRTSFVYFEVLSGGKRIGPPYLLNSRDLLLEVCSPCCGAALTLSDFGTASNASTRCCAFCLKAVVDEDLSPPGSPAIAPLFDLPRHATKIRETLFYHLERHVDPLELAIFGEPILDRLGQMMEFMEANSSRASGKTDEEYMHLVNSRCRELSSPV